LVSLFNTGTPEIPMISQAGQGQFPQSSADYPGISSELQTVLQHVVDDVVAGLSCVGAMVATLEAGNTLPVRAYSVDIAPGLLRQLESRLGISFVGARSVAYLDDRRFKDNLAVRAIHGKNGHPEAVVSGSLHDLFRPVVNKRLSDLAQRLTGIKQVVAVPFFLEDEVVGNLFAAARDEFSLRDINFLTAFGHQAATAIQSQRRLVETQALERVILALQANITDETEVLQTIVDAVVHKLGYAGAMVATLESNNSLPVRAYSVDIAQGLLRQLEDRLGVGMIGPRSVAYIYDERFKDNLSVRAIKGANGRPEIVTSGELYDLFRPVVNKPLSDLAQKLTGIKQVVAVPFFLEDEVVGNLFVATRRAKFSGREKGILTTFGQQAAVGIRNARLYRKSEERRRIAQMFGKMAFSAAAYVHELRNHIGNFRTYLDLTRLLPQLSAERSQEVLETALDVLLHLNRAADILDNLHEPWRDTPDIPTDVNACLTWAIRKVFPKARLGLRALENDVLDTQAGIVVHTSLPAGLPAIKTSPDMLIEVFRVLVKNAAEAIQERGQGNDLWLESRLGAASVIEVMIRDCGTGIKSENLNKIFELGWSTKKEGMGFGLFWAKDFVEGLGGNIQVESVWGQGTTFCVSLPVSVK
jgi:signal transduction histidine kinase